MRLLWLDDTAAQNVFLALRGALVEELHEICRELSMLFDLDS